MDGKWCQLLGVTFQLRKLKLRSKKLFINPIYRCGVKMNLDINPIYAELERFWPRDSKNVSYVDMGLV